MKRMSIDSCMMTVAETVAQRSKDPRTKIGAVFSSADGVILSTGYNCFPRKIGEDDHPEWLDDKYKYIEHAERNAIYNAARIGVSLIGSTLYCRWQPCHECSRALIQVGCVRVVYRDVVPDRWLESVRLGEMMLKLGGVMCVQLVETAY